MSYYEHNSAKNHVFQTLNDEWWEENEKDISYKISLEGSEEFVGFGYKNFLSGTNEQEIELITAVDLMDEWDWEKFQHRYEHDANEPAVESFLHSLKHETYELKSPLWNSKIETEEQLDELNQMFRDAANNWAWIVGDLLYVFHKIKPSWAENKEYYKTSESHKGKAFLDYEPWWEDDHPIKDPVTRVLYNKIEENDFQIQEGFEDESEPELYERIIKRHHKLSLWHDNKTISEYKRNGNEYYGMSAKDEHKYWKTNPYPHIQPITWLIK